MQGQFPRILFITWGLQKGVLKIGTSVSLSYDYWQIKRGRRGGGGKGTYPTHFRPDEGVNTN